MEAAELRQRQQHNLPAERRPEELEKSAPLHNYAGSNDTYWNRAAKWMQDSCYQILAYTVWDRIMSGFKPGRERAFELMAIQPDDAILLVGEGSGLDFECLPEATNKAALRAFDFSPEMVRQSKVKAAEKGIPVDNCFEGDAQRLPFTEEKFGKIYFPLSIGSIPNPSLALAEAERVLAPKGRIIVFEKLVDEDQTVSWTRRAVNSITKWVFADINRELGTHLSDVPALKLTHYESLEGKLDGIFARYLGQYYRIAVIVRDSDYPDEVAVPAKVE